MIITVGGIKGGSGKSTLATHLAVIYAGRGHKVLLVDTDEQATSYDFYNYRMARLGDAGFTCTKQHGGRVHSALTEFAQAFDAIIVDTGRGDTKAQRSALTVSDVLVLPVVPRPYDTWTLEDVFEMAEQVRLVNDHLRMMAFINRADRSGPLLASTDEYLRDAQKHGLDYCSIRLHTRVAYGASAAVGLAVHELQSRDNKAAEEMMLLAGYIYGFADKPLTPEVPHANTSTIETEIAPQDAPADSGKRH